MGVNLAEATEIGTGSCLWALAKAQERAREREKLRIRSECAPEDVTACGLGLLFASLIIIVVVVVLAARLMSDLIMHTLID